MIMLTVTRSISKHSETTTTKKWNDFFFLISRTNRITSLCKQQQFIYMHVISFHFFSFRLTPPNGLSDFRYE